MQARKKDHLKKTYWYVVRIYRPYSHSVIYAGDMLCGKYEKRVYCSTKK